MTIPTLVACFAHPDDEAFTCGGTLSYYAQQGVRVILVCATRGEAGEIADPSLATPETLGAVREQELRNAGKVFGLSEIIFLDYRDSGMVNTEDNQRPDAYINAPTDNVVQRLVKIIRQYQPLTVITFEPGGGYGHPDHLAIHHQTTAAVAAAAFQSYMPALGQPHQVQRLFYTSLARSVMIGLRDVMRLMGRDASWWDDLEKQPHWSDGFTSLLVDISSTIKAKWEGIQCHQTQLGENSFIYKLPADALHRIPAIEQFVLAPQYPTPTPPLTNLLDGLL